MGEMIGPLQVPELPIYETVRKIPTGRMARGPSGPRLVQLRWSSGILQDGAENMEKNTKKTDFNGKEKRD